MLISVVNQGAVLAMVALLVWAAVTDVRTMRIPNRIVIAVVALYPLWLLTHPAPIDGLWALPIAVGMLLAGFAAFSAGVIGGGDAKLLAAVSLWAGPAHLVGMLAVTAVFGGVLAAACILTLVVRRRACLVRGGAIDPQSRPAQQAIAYGVAIALGGLYVAYRLMVPIDG